MATTLTLTENVDGSVHVDVSGAPTPGAALYSETFTASAGGWAGVAAATLEHPAPGHTGDGLAIVGPIGGPDALELAGRVGITPTPGQLYELEAWVYTDDPADTVALYFDGIRVTDDTHTEGWTLLRGVGSAPGAAWLEVRTTTGWWSTSTRTTRTLVDDVKVAPVAAGWVPDTPVVRTDGNGTRPLRLAQSERITAGALAVDDHEAATTGLVSYTVTDSTGATATASLTRSTWRPPVLLDPFLPTRRVQLAQVTRMDHRREAGGAVTHDVDAIFPAVSGRLRGRRGPLEVYALTYADALAVEQLAAGSPVLLYRQSDHPGADRYLAVRGTSVAVSHLSTAGARWLVTLDHEEVAHPAGWRYGGPAWTFDALAESGHTFDTLPAAWATFDALAEGGPA